MGIKEIDLLAIIAAGTKRKKRTVNILKVAGALNELYQTNNSLIAVSKIVKLSPEMVRQFLQLLKLTKEVKSLVKKGLINSIDTAYRISKLIPQNQEILAKSIVNNKLCSRDVRAIVKYKIDNPKVPMQKTISIVLESKVKKIYVAYLGIDKEIFEQLEKISRNQIIEKLLYALFEKIIHRQNIVEFSLKGRVVLVKMTGQGLCEIRTKAKELKIPLAKIANAIVKEFMRVK